MAGIFLCFHHKSAKNGREHAKSCHGQRQNYPCKFQPCANSQGYGGNNGADEGFVEVCSHAGHIPYIISHVICDHSRISGVVFRNASLYLPHQIRSHISSFSEDSPAHSGKKSHGTCADAEVQHGAGYVLHPEACGYRLHIGVIPVQEKIPKAQV